MLELLVKKLAPAPVLVLKVGCGANAGSGASFIFLQLQLRRADNTTQLTPPGAALPFSFFNSNAGVLKTPLERQHRLRRSHFFSATPAPAVELAFFFQQHQRQERRWRSTAPALSIAPNINNFYSLTGNRNKVL